MTCTECRAELPEGARACPSCGAPVIICYECGRPLEAGSAVCPGCGAPQRLCSECGRPLENGAAICRGCGAPINAGIPQVQMPAQAPQAAGSSPLVLCALILAFVFPIAGLIIGLIARKSCLPSEKKMLRAALIVAVILTIAEAILLAVFLPKLIHTLNTGGKVSDFFKKYFS